MGCGATVSSQVRPVSPSSPFGATGSYMSAPTDEPPAIPGDIVLCSATRPDWSSMDYIVFEVADESEKAGRFYTKREQDIGTWRILGNVLTLVWPLDLRTDTVIAVKTPRKWTNQKARFVIEVLEPRGHNPDWFLPDLLAEKFQAETVASKCFECPICFFELYKFPTGVIRLHSKRTCGHYFHMECATYMLKEAKGTGRAAHCPLCGMEFAEVHLMPSLVTEPREWFSTVDVNFGGELDTYEVIEALGCVLPLERHKLEKNVRAHWHEWDPDGDGTISIHEFAAPGRGLRDWILNNVTLMRADHAATTQRETDVPSIDSHPRQWFHYWDRNDNGSLEKDELVRAMVRTFCRDDNGIPSLKKAHDMREVANSMWTAIGYGAFDSVNLEEFAKPYGLLDQFLHNQTHLTFFGLDAELVL